jgi:hypothetical protein
MIVTGTSCTPDTSVVMSIMKAPWALPTCREMARWMPGIQIFGDVDGKRAVNQVSPMMRQWVAHHALRSLSD